jgi:sugar (pentulose or hexulose) kinase
VHEIAVVGGGGASPLVRDRIAAHTGVAVVAGVTEATALGNAMLQGIACGRFRDLADARAWARRS